MSLPQRVPPFRLDPVPLDEAARHLNITDVGPPEFVGTRHRLGGEPTFMHESALPSCAECHQEMSFYGQLDSIDLDNMIADCGMIFVFFCFSCNTAATIVQSY